MKREMEGKGGEEGGRRDWGGGGGGGGGGCCFFIKENVAERDMSASTLGGAPDSRAFIAARSKSEVRV